MPTKIKEKRAALKSVAPAAAQPTQAEIDRARLTELCAELAVGLHQGDKMEADINGFALGTTQMMRAEYDGHCARLETLERELTALVRAHPEWFPEDRKSFKTAYGTVKLTPSTRLVYEDEAAVIEAIRENAVEPDTYLRETVELDLEALERISEEDLALFGITRERRQKINFAPIKIAGAKTAK